MKLYEYRRSRSIRCRWMLEELAVSFDSQEIDLANGAQRNPEFLKINPNGKVPVLVDGPTTLFESVAICTYLADKFPQKGLIPAAGTPERGLYNQWMFFCVAELDCNLWITEKHTWFYPEEKRSDVAAERAKEEFVKSASILNQYLDNKTYLIGNSFTAADIVICQTLIWANGRKLLADFPALTSYMERLKERPAFPRSFYK